MKKNQKIIISLFLTVILVVILLVKLQISTSSENDEQNTEIAGEVNENLNLKTKPQIEKPREVILPAIEKMTQVKSPQEIKKNEFTAEDLKKINVLRVQAKSALAATYTALASFHAEYGRYTTDLKSTGFTPSLGEMHYMLGFLKPFFPSDEMAKNSNEDLNSNRNLTTDVFLDVKENKSDQVYKYGPDVEKINLDNYSKYCEKGCTATENEFEILLVLPLLNSDKVDVWVVNNRKVIKQIVDGTQ